VLRSLELPVALVTLTSVASLLAVVELDWLEGGLRIGAVGAVLTAQILWGLRHRYSGR